MENIFETLDNLHQTQETLRLVKTLKLKDTELDIFDLEVLVIAHIDMLVHEYSCDRLDSIKINTKLLQTVRNSINYIYEDITNYSLKFYEEIENNNYEIIKFYPYKLICILKKVNEINKYITENKVSTEDLYKLLNIIRRINHTVSKTKDDYYKLVDLIKSEEKNLDKIRYTLNDVQSGVDNINRKTLAEQLNISNLLY